MTMSFGHLFAETPAPAQQPVATAADKAVDESLATFYKLKNRPNAEAALEALKAAIDEKKTAGDYAGAIKLAIKGASVAKMIKSKEYAKFQALKKTLIQQRDTAILKAKLQKTLAADPKNKRAREQLVHIALLREDDPAAAAKLSDETLTEGLRQVITLAEKEPDQLTDAEAMLLAKWYYKNGSKQPAAKKRTIKYLETFLDKHDKQDAEYKQAQKLLSKLNAAGGKLGKNTFRIPARSDWVATLELKAGKKYHVDAPGVWYGGPKGKFGTKANGDGGMSKPNRATNYLEGKHPIAGSGFRTRRISAKGFFTATEAGMLYLRMHDTGDRSDNEGALIVVVTEAVE